jgi:hypothetical protein
MRTGISLLSAALALFAATPALAQSATADISVSDQPGSTVYAPGQSALGKIRVFNNNSAIGFSSYGVTATIEPVLGGILSLTPRGGTCVRGGNGSQICSLFRIDGQKAKFVEFDVVLSSDACSVIRNGQVKIARAYITSKTADPIADNNMTNVYVKLACP